LSSIDLVLTDDWELRGDGSGDMRQIQFESLRHVAQIYEDAGFRGSFNAEVMQQLYHRSEGQRHPHLLELAQQWDDLLRQTFAHGHDVQLHMHPQWHAARYTDGHWHLPSDWMLGNHPAPRIQQMLRDCKAYLEDLLRPIDASYQCISFRAGTWALVSGADTLPALIDAGITIDTSIAPGLVKSDDDVDVDYSQVRRELLPYYPSLDDPRQIAPDPLPLVCVPTHTFLYTPLAKIWDTLAGRPEKRFDQGSYTIRFKSFVKEHTFPTHFVSDLSALSYSLMVRMLDDIRRKHEAAGVPVVPVVLTNHTKDLTDFRPIQQFAQLLATAQDVRVISLRQLAANIRSGRYPVRSSGHANAAAWRTQVLPSS
jgi:hypothetical protein